MAIDLVRIDLVTPCLFTNQVLYPTTWAISWVQPVLVDKISQPLFCNPHHK